MSETKFEMYNKLVNLQRELVDAQQRLNHTLTFLVVYLMEQGGSDRFNEERISKAMQTFEDNNTLPVINFEHPEDEEGVVILKVNETDAPSYNIDETQEAVNQLYDVQGRLIGGKLDA